MTISQKFESLMPIIIGTSIALSALPALAVVNAGQGDWASTLLGRDLNGRAVDATSPAAIFFYDETLNITWLRDGYYAGRDMTWDQASGWASNLRVGAFSGWRLPVLKPVNGTAFQYGFSSIGSTDAGYAATGTGWASASEMGHLFYVTLGNYGACMPDWTASPNSCTQPAGFAFGNINTGAFTNLLSFYSNYWFGVGNSQSADKAWSFSFGTGLQTYNLDKAQSIFTLTVRNGDVAALPVPEPESALLMLLGIGSLAMLAWRKQATRQNIC